MKRAKANDVGSNSMDKISELPQAILQRILYLLYQREAVRTSVLSKSWRYIWCTRPNLEFSDAFFMGKKQNFLSVVDGTLQRYADQGLGVDEFSLSISDHLVPVALLEKWISLLTTNMCVKDFRLFSYFRRIDLPTVIFKAESIEILHLRKCMFVGEKSTPVVKIAFVRLKVLHLEQVFVEQDVYDEIASSCPLLTTIVFKDCEGLKTIKLDKQLHKYLKHFTCTNSETHNRTDECSIEIDLPTLETIEIDGNKFRFHCHDFINMKHLSLNWLRTHADSAVGHYHEPSCMIDAGPDLLHFEHVGSFIPSLSFKPTLRSSKVQVRIRGVQDARSWFRELSELLQALRRSKISLNITQLTNMDIQDGVLLRHVTNGGNKPVVVEDLQLNYVHLSSLPSLFNNLFCIFRPRKITLPWSMGLHLKKEKQKFVRYICNIRVRKNYQKIWHDLKDLSLSIEGFDRSRQRWQPLETLSECLPRPDISSICIRLKWSEACNRVEF